MAAYYISGSVAWRRRGEGYISQRKWLKYHHQRK